MSRAWSSGNSSLLALFSQSDAFCLSRIASPRVFRITIAPAFLDPTFRQESLDDSRNPKFRAAVDCVGQAQRVRGRASVWASVSNGYDASLAGYPHRPHSPYPDSLEHFACSPMSGSGNKPKPLYGLARVSAGLLADSGPRPTVAARSRMRPSKPMAARRHPLDHSAEQLSGNSSARNVRLSSGSGEF